MKFGIGVICKTLCSKFEFLECLHRKIVLRDVSEFIPNCPHFMSDWGDILAGDMHVMLFSICVSSKCARASKAVRLLWAAVHVHAQCTVGHATFGETVCAIHRRRRLLHLSSPPEYPDGLWVSSSRPYNRLQGLLPGCKAAEA